MGASTAPLCLAHDAVISNFTIILLVIDQLSVSAFAVTIIVHLDPLTYQILVKLLGVSGAFLVSNILGELKFYTTLPTTRCS